MNQCKEKRRKSSAKFYDAIIDRRSSVDRRGRSVVVSAPAIPGMIRPLPGEQVQVERRRFPESGTE